MPGTYGTIQLAINAANDGDTITVAAGTYNENVIVNKSISLIGQGRDQTIINGQDIGTTVRISSSNVVISGFEITHGRNESILIEPQAANCEIYSNSITYAYERGIMINGPNNQIYDNIAHDCGMGGVNNAHGVIESISPNSHDNSVFNNYIYSCNTWGIGSNNANSIIIFNNTVISCQTGVLIDWSSYNDQVYNNKFYTSNFAGVNVLRSYNNSIMNNDIQGCNVGINFGVTSHDNNIFDNSIQNCQGGFMLNATNSNRIFSNNVTSSSNYGFRLSDSSSNNIIFNNRLTSVPRSVAIVDPVGSNTWDNGYPSGGNYWSDYPGKDIFNGALQNHFGQDGIGDTAYSINSNNYDNYPLVNIQPPTDNFLIGPSAPTQSQTITFNAASETSPEGTFTYLWNFGDGVTVQSNTSTTTHQYSSSGTYTVSLTVTDNIGGQLQRTQTITIASNPTSTPTPHPTANPTSTPTPTNSTTPTETPTPTESTPTPTPSETTPLVRNLNPSAAIINIPLNPISPQLLATTATATGAIGIASVTTVAIAKISGNSISQIENLQLPKPLQSVLKKFAEKKLEALFKKKKIENRKNSLISKRELSALFTTIVAMSFVMGFVMANGLPNVLNPLTFLRFFTGALLSVFITQTVSFFLEIYFSHRSKIQKEVTLWSLGSVLYFLSGLALKFPFSSPMKTKTIGSYKYLLSTQKKVNALTAVTKGFVLSLPIIPFAILAVSPVSELSCCWKYWNTYNFDHSLFRSCSHFTLFG